MKTEEQMEKMLSLAHYRYHVTCKDIWEGWKWALTWALEHSDDKDYDYVPKNREVALQLAKELGIPKEWI